MRVTSLLEAGLAGLLSVASSAGGGAAQPPAPLKAGDAAPAFSAPGSDGKTHLLAASRGKRAVVLAWFPKAFTGG